MAGVMSGVGAQIGSVAGMAAGGWAAYGSKLAEATAKTTTTATATTTTTAAKETAKEVAKEGTTVIGEGMKRVSKEAAKHSGSVILNNMPKFTGTADHVTSQMMSYNRQWILQQMRTGRPILDIGLDITRTHPSIFYQMEQNMINNYLKLHPNAFQIITP
jgi:hypothetical protein